MLLVRNTDWSRHFWNTIYQMDYTLGDWWQEQRAVIDFYKQRQDSKDHIKVLAHRHLQSNPPGNGNPGYEPGDFLLHFAGEFCSNLDVCKQRAIEYKTLAENILNGITVPPEETKIAIDNTEKNEIYATVLTDDNAGKLIKLIIKCLTTSDAGYGDGALVMFYGLRKSGTNRKFVAFVTAEVSNKTRDRFQRMGVDVREIPKISSNGFFFADRFKDSFTKFSLWKYEEYSKIVYIDADHLILQNIDDLFNCENFCAVKDNLGPRYFNAGLFVLAPSMVIYSKMMEEFTKESHNNGYADQDFLNWFFRDWKEYPYEYNAIWFNRPADMNYMKTIHEKFWLPSAPSPEVAERWYQELKEMKDLYGWD